MKKINQNEIRYKVIFCLLLIICVFMHIFRLGDIPYGINCDEMGMGYDSWCLANFGVDRYQNSFPVYLINFSGGQSALYAYLCMPFVKLMGFTALAFRMPIAIASSVTLLFILLIVDRIWPANKWMKIIALGIYTICPVFAMLFRIGLDCNLMLAVTSIFIFVYLKAIDMQKLRFFLLTGFVGGIMLYSYVLSHFALPIFLVFSLGYLLYQRKIHVKQILVMAIPLFILALPLLLMHYINMNGLDEIHLGIFTVPKLYRYRSDDMSLDGVINNIKIFGKRTLIYDGIKYNSLPKYPPMYYVSIPFLVIGCLHGIYDFVKSMTKREYNEKSFILLWAIAMFLVGSILGNDGPVVYRMNAIYLPYLFFVIDGLWFLGSLIKKYAQKIWLFYSVAIIGIYAVCFGMFAKYYFLDYAEDTYLLDYFNFTFEDVLDYVDTQMTTEVQDRTTYVGDVAFSYIYFLGSTGLTPFEYTQLEDDTPYTLYLWMSSFENYVFSFPETIDPLGNYILTDTDSEYVRKLDEYGLEKVHIGHYYFYYNSLLQDTQSNAEALMSLDHGIVDDMVIPEGDNTVISGWSLNATNGTTWGDILVQVGEKYYVADKQDRSDVVEVTGNPDLLECGMHVTIPTEELLNNEAITLICMDYQNRAVYRQNMRIEVGKR